MNPLLQYILVQRAKSKLEGVAVSKTERRRRLVEEIRAGQVEFVHGIREYLFIAIGVGAAGFGLKGFLLPNEFIDGGATGA